MEVNNEIMEIVSFEKRTFEEMAAKLDYFVQRMDDLCRQHGEKKAERWMDSHAVASVILQCPAAHFKQVRHLLVSQQLIAIYGRSALAEQLFERSQKPVEIRVEFTYPLMVFFSDFTTHTVCL